MQNNPTIKTTSLGSTRRATTRLAVGLSAVFALSFAAPAPADAEAQGFTEDTFRYGLFYDDVEEGIVVTVGLRAEQFCFGEFAEAPMRVFSENDGTTTLKVRAAGADLYIYEFEGSAPDLIFGETCTAIFDDDPTTEPRQPIASGEGKLHVTVNDLEGPDDFGGLRIANAVGGVAKSDDGTEWKVHGRAAFETAEDGSPIGDPSEFQSASIREIRRK